MGVDGGESVELVDAERYRYISLQFQEDVLVGAQALGLTNHVGVLRGLIQTKLKLGKWKEHLLADPTRIMEAYLGATQSIGHNAARALSELTDRLYSIPPGRASTPPFLQKLSATGHRGRTSSPSTDPKFAIPAKAGIQLNIPSRSDTLL